MCIDQRAISDRELFSELTESPSALQSVCDRELMLSVISETTDKTISYAAFVFELHLDKLIGTLSSQDGNAEEDFD